LSSFISLETHLADFLDRFRPLCSVQGPGKFPHSDTPVTLNLGSNEGNQRWVSDPLLCVETPSYLLTVPFYIFLIILFIWVPLQGLVAIRTFDSERTDELELECVRDVGGRSKSRPAATNQLTVGGGG
jgi:hypothetical protein